MASWTLQEIADLHGYSAMQTSRHIAKLIKEKKFKKTGVGKYYNEKDTKKLGDLLGFELPQKQTK